MIEHEETEPFEIQDPIEQEEKRNEDNNIWFGWNVGALQSIGRWIIWCATRCGISRPNSEGCYKY